MAGRPQGQAPAGEDRWARVSLDQIALRGLRVHGYHGVFGQRTHDGQEFIIDAVLWTDTALRRDR